jgi:hypothetical protein
MMEMLINTFLTNNWRAAGLFSPLDTLESGYLMCERTNADWPNHG